MSQGLRTLKAHADGVFRTVLCWSRHLTVAPFWLFIGVNKVLLKLCHAGQELTQTPTGPLRRRPLPLTGSSLPQGPQPGKGFDWQLGPREFMEVDIGSLEHLLEEAGAAPVLPTHAWLSLPSSAAQACGGYPSTRSISGHTRWTG